MIIARVGFNLLQKRQDLVTKSSPGGYYEFKFLDQRNYIALGGRKKDVTQIGRAAQQTISDELWLSKTRHRESF